MAHTDKHDLKSKFEDGDRPTGEDFANLLDSCHNTEQDTDVTINKSLTVKGACRFKDALAVDGDLSVEGDINCAGSGVFQNNLNVTKSAGINDKLTVHGETHLKNTLTVNKGVHLQDEIVVDGSASIANDIQGHGKLTVDKQASFQDNVLISGETDISNTLHVAGATTLANSVVIESDAHVIGDSVFDKNVHIKGDLRVDGNAFLDAGASGNINVGDSDSDNVLFHADIGTGLTPNTDDTYSLGNTDARWKEIHASNVIASKGINLTGELSVDGNVTTTGKVNGRDIATDGENLDHVAADMVVVESASGGWDTTEAIVESKKNYWDDTRTTVGTFSASWEESLDIQAVAEDVATVAAISADWTDSRTTVNANSATWNIDKLVDLADVDAGGLSNNSVLRYDSVLDKWVPSTTEDEKATGSITILLSDTQYWTGRTVTLTDNHDPIHTVSFTGDSNIAHGEYLKVTDWEYKVGVGGAASKNQIAESLAIAINAVQSTGNLEIAAEVIDDRINLSQLIGGVGGNVSIDGTAENITIPSDPGAPGGFNGGVETSAGTISIEIVSQQNGTAFDKTVTTNGTDTLDTLLGSGYRINLQAGGNAGGEIPLTGQTIVITGGRDVITEVGPVAAFLNFTGGENPDAFEALDDTPASYAGHGGKLVKVKPSEDGLEFIEDLTLTEVSITSGSWNEATAVVNSTSADWNDARTTLNASSADWYDARTSLNSTSADWNDTRTTLNTTSADWSDTRTTLNATSADWNDARTTLNASSADWYDARTTLNATSADWNDTRTTLNATSADWNDARTTLNATSADWNDARTSVMNTSGDWNDARTTLNASSADWYDARTTLNATSADWSDTRTTLNASSADWYDARTTLNATSADWSDTRVSVMGSSASWDDVYSHINSISGAGFANVDKDGKIVLDQVPELSITRVHTANNPSDVELLNPSTGIQVGDVVVVMSTHDNLIALVDDPTGVYDTSTKDYTGYAKLAMPDGLVQTVNGKPGPSVVLNPDDLVDDATAHKFVSQIQIDEWTDTRTNISTFSGTWVDTTKDMVEVAAISGDWNDARTTLNTTSADWNDARATLNAVSADWSDARTTLNATSADWNDTRASVMEASGSWDSVYNFVNSDSATNNSSYNEDTYVNVTGDKMTGNLHLDGAELIVGGNITMAGDLIHENDTGTRISFSDDTISLEANGDEFITIDGTAPTPDAIIINDPASTAIHFQVKSVDKECALVVDGQTGNVNIGQCIQDNTGGALEVNGVFKANDIEGENIICTSGKILSGAAGVELHEIFSTSTDIRGDLTVHGSVSSQTDMVAAGTMTVSGDTILGSNIVFPNTPASIEGTINVSEDVTAETITANESIKTVDDQGVVQTGVTEDINIGGHILHIVNGIIVKVTDE